MTVDCAVFLRHPLGLWAVRTMMIVASGRCPLRLRTVKTFVMRWFCGVCTAMRVSFGTQRHLVPTESWFLDTRRSMFLSGGPYSEFTAQGRTLRQLCLDLDRVMGDPVHHILGVFESAVLREALVQGGTCFALSTAVSTF
mmetsp:Transcript_29918/g.79672  ORF Transcript_29918/g.79672 Transcript_29918/m.79672 type:complete len:140 (-) Transcript_29918:99-518(-)